MPSPFPGMDPYLENPAIWGGVHGALIIAMMAELNRILPPSLAAINDEYVWVHEEADDGVPSRQLVRPDVFVPESNGTGGTAVLVAEASAPTAEVTLRSAARRRRRYIHITDLADNSVVTVVELLSPSNKRCGPDRDAYLAKRAECLASVNLVEIDLLRPGPRMPLGEGTPADDYYVFACRPGAAPTGPIWSWGVREPMPVPSVPLRPGMPAVPLALRRALDRVYDDGRYSTRIGYARPPVPPLRRSDAAWAAELLAAQSPEGGV